jgi:Flp pilus assembly secretin CpaC
MKKIPSLFLALGLLLSGSFGGVMLWSLLMQPGRAQGESGGFGGGFGEEFGGGFNEDSASYSSREYAPAQQVWIEAMFIQIDTAALDGIHVGGEPVVGSTGEKAYLTAAEKLDLLGQLKSQPSFRIVGSASLVTISGQQALMQMVEEIRYPTEYDAGLLDEEATESGEFREWYAGPPGTFEEREAGTRFNVTPTFSSDGLITLILLPEVSRVAAWHDLGAGTADQPVFRSWNLTTQIYCQSGMTFMMTGTVAEDFQSVLPADLVARLDGMGKTTAILLISARTIEVKLDEEASE